MMSACMRFLYKRSFSLRETDLNLTKFMRVCIVIQGQTLTREQPSGNPM